MKIFCSVLALLLANPTIEARLGAAVGSPPNCNIALDPIGEYSCLKACLGKHQADEDSFVCDVSAQWMHHVGGTSDWYPATPPKGTGIHEYGAYKGAPPCLKNGHCPACAAPRGSRLCSVTIDPEDCSVKCEDTSHLMEMVVSPFLEDKVND